MRKTLKWMVLGLLALVIMAAVGGYLMVRSAGHPKIDGDLKLTGLSAPVKVVRDELGVPYITAANTPDLLKAQGFVTAQDRLLQMELFRATWRGELAATFGPDALPSDIRMRVLGMRRNGDRHALKLDAPSRAYLQSYADGVNAYVKDHPGDHPIELKAAGLKPSAWSVADLVTLVHFIHYTHSTNFKAEIVGQKLIDKLGLAQAREIMPLTVNPDWGARPAPAGATAKAGRDGLRLGVDWAHLSVAPETLNHQGLGSNNWAIGPSRSASGKAMVVNDPHLDSRILPGYWYPVGLFTPEIQAIGAALPGMPGILVGRTKHVAFGVTNAYGDVQDVYIETLDPNDKSRYLHGAKSTAFTVVEETIRIKDKAAPGGLREQPLRIRYTVHGPVISDHPGLGTGGDKILALRSTDAEVLAPVLGIEGLLTAPDAAAFDREVQKIDLMMFNFVFADDQGKIGHRATGAVPIRAGADGSLPRVALADGSDDWTGFIPKDRMPGMMNPQRAWVGTANNDTTPQGFEWYYTNYVSPDYRYRRIGEVLGAGRKMTVDDHWKLMTDDRNLQSDVLRATIVAALKADAAHKDLAAILDAWDGVDRADQAAPLVYQALYRQIALATFTPRLGDDVAQDMLSTWYFWQQRFDALAATPDSPWFDDPATNGRETLADVIRAAAPKARAELETLQGKDPAAWRWGKAHALRFVSPLRRNGAGQELVGGFTVERPGSGETLNRGVYDFMKPYDVNFFASMRVVTDFGDPDKIDAVIAGGVSERHFQPHQNDQARLLVANERRAWWFNPAKAEANAKSTLQLVP